MTFAAKKMNMNNCRKTAIKSFAEVGKNRIVSHDTTKQQFETKTRAKNNCRKIAAEVPQKSYFAVLEKCRKILPQNPPPIRGGGVFCGSNVFGYFFQPA
jgi:hypothetical protein